MIEILLLNTNKNSQFFNVTEMMDIHFIYLFIYLLWINTYSTFQTAKVFRILLIYILT